MSALFLLQGNVSVGKKSRRQTGQTQSPTEPGLNLNCDQMEEREQYNEYSMERNLRAYTSMRDYRNLPWQNQQPLGRNPNPYRSMRDYRN